MTNKARIPKGGFTVARQIFSSPIWFKDPLFLKLWVWIIGQANHENIKKNGFQYRRGEVVTTYTEIMKALAYRHNRKYIKPTLKKVRIMLEWLVNEEMIRVDPLQENAQKTTNPELTERCRTGADTTALTRAYVGIKIIVVNYDTYQDLRNYKGRHKGRHLSEQGHYNNNDLNNNEYNNNKTADNLYQIYLTEITPGQKTKQRAFKNIQYHIKKHSFDDLKASIENYKSIALTREPTFRKDPANFFGKQEPAFIDYLPGNYSPAPGYQPPPQESLEELFK